MPSPWNTRARQRAAALAGDEHVGARRALRVRQHPVLLHDQRAPQRHHHQHAEDAAREGEQRDLEVVEVGRPARRQEDERGNREHDAAGHRLAGRSDRLHDVVLEDGRPAEPLEHRDREHRDRDRRADGEAGAQPEVDGDAPKIRPNRAPNRIARRVNSGIFRSSGTKGRKVGSAAAPVVSAMRPPRRVGLCARRRLDTGLRTGWPQRRGGSTQSHGTVQRIGGRAARQDGSQRMGDRAARAAVVRRRSRMAPPLTPPV